MDISNFEQVYGSAFSSNSTSLHFQFQSPQVSHVRMKAVLRSVSRECQLGILVCDENRRRVNLHSFSSFQFSISGQHWYEMREHKGKINKLIVSPLIRHVKEAIFCFSPKVELEGKSLYFRIVCFEKGQSKFYADSKELKLLPSVLKTPPSRPRTVQRQSTGVWKKQVEEKIEHTGLLMELEDDEIFDISCYGFDDGDDGVFDNHADIDFDVDAFMGNAPDSKQKLLEERVAQLEKELEDAKAKFFTTSNRDESKRCDKCYDVISLPYCRSIFWVHQEQCFEKFHCYQCESKAKELRRKLLKWYWKDGGAHDPQDYANRVAFTKVNKLAECQHWTVEDLGTEFDKPFYVS